MILLINPPLSFDKRDPLTTGIVYMPIGLAQLAGSLGSVGSVAVIDAFGEAPENARPEGEFVLLGLDADTVADRVREIAPKAVVVYANQVANHEALLTLIRRVRGADPNTPILVAENTQAVTAYSIAELKDDFHSAGATYVLPGEPEVAIVESLRQMGLVSVEKPLELTKKGQISNLDSLPLPKWSLFPLNNYWRLKYAHGPLTSDKYLPILTSRGCPYPCKFCVVPKTNERRWRARSAESVVHEMEFMLTTHGVREFHLEDLNPTIKDQRMREIAEEILRRDLRITWKIVAGTKIETIKSVETLELLTQSGLRYLSMSPESGSSRLLREIGKPFDQEHAIRMVKAARRLGVRTQACFVLGYPGETRDDVHMSRRLIRRLTLAGIDEVALFIATPIPGSEIAPSFDGQFASPAELTFSPMWRPDYGSLQRTRMRFYATFLVLKALTRPLTIVQQVRNFRSQTFETKMEMVPFRALRYRKIIRGLDK